MTSKNKECNIDTCLNSIQKNRKKEEEKKERLDMEKSSYTFFAFFIIISVLIFEIGISGSVGNSPNVGIFQIKIFLKMAFLSSISISFGLLGFILSRAYVYTEINKKLPAFTGEKQESIVNWCKRIMSGSVGCCVLLMFILIFYTLTSLNS